MAIRRLRAALRRHARIAFVCASAALLARPAALWSRPKVLVAGLSRRLECFFDAKGDCAGAVSTWTITHPKDDGGALRAFRVGTVAGGAVAGYGLAF